MKHCHRVTCLWVLETQGNDMRSSCIHTHKPSVQNMLGKSGQMAQRASPVPARWWELRVFFSFSIFALDVKCLTILYMVQGFGSRIWACPGRLEGHPCNVQPEVCWDGFGLPPKLGKAWHQEHGCWLGQKLYNTRNKNRTAPVRGKRQGGGWGVGRRWAPGWEVSARREVFIDLRLGKDAGPECRVGSWLPAVVPGGAIWGWRLGLIIPHPSWHCTLSKCLELLFFFFMYTVE